MLLLTLYNEAKASPQMLDYYCGCRGKLELMPGTSKIKLIEGAEFPSCETAFHKIYDDDVLGVTGNYLEKFEEFSRKMDQDGKPICNNTEIKDYLGQYKKLQTKSEAQLEDKVEVLLCRSNTDNKGKRKAVNDCREA